MWIFCNQVFQVILSQNIKVKKTQFGCNWASRFPGNQPVLTDHRSSAQDILPSNRL